MEVKVISHTDNPEDAIVNSYLVDNEFPKGKEEIIQEIITNQRVYLQNASATYVISDISLLCSRLVVRHKMALGKPRYIESLYKAFDDYCISKNIPIPEFDDGRVGMVITMNFRELLQLFEFRIMYKVDEGYDIFELAQRMLDLTLDFAPTIFGGIKVDVCTPYFETIQFNNKTKLIVERCDKCNAELDSMLVTDVNDVKTKAILSGSYCPDCRRKIVDE